MFGFPYKIKNKSLSERCSIPALALPAVNGPFEIQIGARTAVPQLVVPPLARNARVENEIRVAAQGNEGREHANQQLE